MPRRMGDCVVAYDCPAPAASSSANRKTPCPKVSTPSQGRVDACKAGGGTLTAVETDGCVRGYECVKPK